MTAHVGCRSDSDANAVLSSFRESFWRNKDLSDLVRRGDLFGVFQKLFQHKREHIDRFQNQLFPMADIAL